MTLPTRDELVKKMARAMCCPPNGCGEPCEGPPDQCDWPAFYENAADALTAIEAVLPVGRILSGEWFAAPMAPNFSMIKAGADKMEGMDAEKPYPHAARQIWWAMAEKRPAHPQTLGQQIGYEE